MDSLQTRSRTWIGFALFLMAAVIAVSSYSRVLAAKRAVLAQGTALRSASTRAGTTPVIVELFTSEGCSSCPPADALLARLDREQPVRGADIIILEEHVDYWDHQGWKDRFSSATITERQKQYQSYFKLDDIYTPQAIVNGSVQFNGADAKSIETSIASASSTPLSVSTVAVNGNTVRFSLGEAVSPSARVFAALVDPEDTTEVRAGENGGRTLHHAGVVRALSPVAEPFTIIASAGSNLPRMRLVVFTQTKPVGPIRAATSCSLEPHASTSGPERCPIATTPTKMASSSTQ